MKASFEITGGLIRVFLDPDAKFGDPFDFMIGVVGNEGEAILKGLSAPGNSFPPKAFTAIREELRRMGFHTAVWSRRGANGTKLRDVRFNLLA